MARIALKRSTGTGYVDIVVKAPEDLIAPVQIWVKAENVSGLAPFDESGAVYEGDFHEYHYEWTIRGEPLSAWSKPQNLVAEHNNPNKRFGREAGFVLPSAGSYIIDLVVTDKNGKTATASTGTQTVVTPESFFAEADRVYIDPDGVYSGVPAASDRYQTLAAFAAAINTYNSNKTWLVLERGKEHSLVGVNSGSNKNGRDQLYFGETNNVVYVSAYGTGDKPLITSGTDHTRDMRNAMFSYREPKDTNWRTFTGLEFDGEFDPETWSGGKRRSGAGIGNGVWRQDAEYGFCHVHDCKFTGTNQGTALTSYANDYNDGFHFMVTDCEADGWRDYGHFGCADNITIGFAGNYYHQRPTTPSFGDKNAYTNSHGPVRIPSARFAAVTMNDLFGRGGWDGRDQAALRLFPDHFTQQSAFVDRNTLTSGWEVVHMRRASYGEGYPANIVLERNLTIGTGQTARHYYSMRSGVTIRDNLMADLNKPRQNTNWGDEAILFAKDSSDLPINKADPIAVHGNTYLVLMDASSDNTSKPFNLVTNAEGYFTNLTEQNNVVHKPAGDITSTDFAPIDIATAITGISVEYAGVQQNYAPVNFYLSSTIANGDPLPLDYDDVTTAEINGNQSTTVGVPTDQAYWQAIEATDTNHQVYVRRNPGDIQTLMFSESGHFSVSFDASVITITNTSGFDWLSGNEITVMLDRKSLKPAMDTTTAISATVPLPRPQTGSAAIGAATSGRVSPKDFLLADRGETPSQGALEPA